jgi:hypothetical protein
VKTTTVYKEGGGTMSRAGDTARRARRIGGVTEAAAVLGLGVFTAPGLGGFKSGTYSGATSQGLNLQLKVNSAKTKMTVVFFEFSAPPCGGKGGLQYAGLKAKIRSDGTFKAKSPADGYYGYVKGRFHGRYADGRALYHYDPSGCNSGDVTWSAEKG